MKYYAIDKKTGEIVYTDINDLIENENNYIFIEEDFSRSLEEIWQQYEEPFIAQNKEGYYVIIDKNPTEQKKKYNYNVYGKIDKSIRRLILKNNSQIIYDFGGWKFIALLN